MATFDYPSISVDGRTNEQNMSQIKAWTMQTVDQLNYYIDYLEDRIAYLENEIRNLQGGK